MVGCLFMAFLLSFDFAWLLRYPEGVVLPLLRMRFPRIEQLVEPLPNLPL